MTSASVPNAVPPPTPYDPGDRYVPVDRRWFGLDKATFVPGLIVLVVAAITSLIIPNLNDSVGYTQHVQAGDVIVLNGGVSFVPAVGWGIQSGNLAQDRPATGYAPTAVVVDGGVKLAAQTGPFQGTVADLIAQIVRTSFSDGSVKLNDDQVVVTNNAGDRGLLVSFSGTHRDGIIAAYVFDGVGVEIVASGPEDVTRQQTAEIGTMITSFTGPQR